MTEKFIIYGLIAISVGLALSYLKSATAPQVSSADSGQLFLRMNKFYGIISIIGIFLGILISTMIVITDEPFIIDRKSVV